MKDHPYKTPPDLTDSYVPSSTFLHRLFFVTPGKVPTWIVADNRELTDMVSVLMGSVGLLAIVLMITTYWTIPFVFIVAYEFTKRIYYPFLKVELRERRRSRAMFRRNRPCEPDSIGYDQ